MPAAITIRGLSKRYRLAPQRAHMLREFLVDQVRMRWQQARNRGENGSGPASAGWFWALKDVSFDVEEGEVIGVIGPNGAGKSTLMKILSRITEPTEGSIKLRGRLASLLEVGTGFHPELTGRENIYLKGAILGMSRAEVRSKFDQIVGFAETEKFLDVPVKHYSSGMYVRLAFAVAAHLDPDILLVDEVLAVGDLAFQTKCLKKLGTLSQSGRTALFVSHNMGAVENLCRKVVVLERGSVAFSGPAKDGISHYVRDSRRETAFSHSIDLSGSAGRPPNCRRLLERVEFFSGNGEPVNGIVAMGAPLKACIHFVLEEPTADIGACLGFNNMLGQRIFTAHTCFQPGLPDEARVGKQVFVCEIPSLALVPGEYKVKVNIDIGSASVDVVEDAVQLKVIESDYYGTGRVPWNGTVVLKHNWRLGVGATQ